MQLIVRDVKQRPNNRPLRCTAAHVVHQAMSVRPATCAVQHTEQYNTCCDCNCCMSAASRMTCFPAYVICAKTSAFVSGSMVLGSQSAPVLPPEPHNMLVVILCMVTALWMLSLRLKLRSVTSLRAALENRRIVTIRGLGHR
eukprot:14927-Heterococcus_DN1.PRE.1